MSRITKRTDVQRSYIIAQGDFHLYFALFTGAKFYANALITSVYIAPRRKVAYLAATLAAFKASDTSAAIVKMSVNHPYSGWLSRTPK